MEEKDPGWRSCLIPIVVFIGAGFVGEFLFWILEKWKTYIAIAIMTIVCFGFIHGLKK